MFESRVTKVIQKLPRSHLILLQVISNQVDESDSGQLHEISTQTLVKEYNYEAK
jgi:hypothetical protein